MNLSPNPIVIGLQAVPYLVTLAGLHYIIFKPVLAHLAGREDAIEGARGRAAELESKLAARTAEYEEKLTAAKAEVTELQAQKRADAQAEADALVAEARAAADAKLEAAVQEVQQQAAVAREGLRESADSLATRIASQVLGRPIAAK